MLGLGLGLGLGLRTRLGARLKAQGEAQGEADEVCTTCTALGYSVRRASSKDFSRLCLSARFSCRPCTRCSFLACFAVSRVWGGGWWLGLEPGSCESGLGSGSGSGLR